MKKRLLKTIPEFDKWAQENPDATELQKFDKFLSMVPDDADINDYIQITGAKQEN